MAGIASYGAYVPIKRLPLALIGGRPAKEGGPEKAVADYDEDAVTMAVSAAIACLEGFDRGAVDAVFFASTTYPLREKQGAATIAKALDLRRDVLAADHAGSPRPPSHWIDSRRAETKRPTVSSRSPSLYRRSTADVSGSIGGQPRPGSRSVNSRRQRKSSTSSSARWVTTSRIDQPPSGGRHRASPAGTPATTAGRIPA